MGEDVDDDLTESLQQQTLEALDLDFILERLQSLCYTATAAEMAVNPEALLAKTPADARALYDTVLELTQLEDADLELEARLDIVEEAGNARDSHPVNAPHGLAFFGCLSIQVEQCTRGAVLVES